MLRAELSSRQAPTAAILYGNFRNEMRRPNEVVVRFPLSPPPFITSTGSGAVLRATGAGSAPLGVRSGDGVHGSSLALPLRWGQLRRHLPPPSLDPGFRSAATRTRSAPTTIHAPSRQPLLHLATVDDVLRPTSCPSPGPLEWRPRRRCGRPPRLSDGRRSHGPQGQRSWRHHERPPRPAGASHLHRREPHRAGTPRGRPSGPYRLEA